LWLGAIQIIRDTLKGTGKCHQMSQGGGRGLANVSRDIFSKVLNCINVFWPAFLKEKGYFFGKSNCHVTPKLFFHLFLTQVDCNNKLSLHFNFVKNIVKIDP